MNLLTTYEHLLHLGGLIVSSDGLISVTHSGDPKPAIISVKENDENVSKRLVLPTNEQLGADGGWENRIAFHPLKENSIHGESRVIEYLRKSINYRLNLIIPSLIEHVMMYATTPEYQKNLSSDHLKLLEVVKNADKTMAQNFSKILKQIKATDTKNGYVSIYLKKLGKIEDVNYACVATLNFPFYQQLLKAEKEFYGVKLRKNDLSTLKHLFEYLIPNIGVDGAYNVGVSGSIASFTEALIKAVDKLAKPLNHVTTLLFKKSKHMGNDKDHYFNHLYIRDDHMAVFNDLDSLLPEIRLIPALPGNEPKALLTQAPVGKTISEIKQEETVEIAPAQTHKWDSIQTQTHSPVSFNPSQVPQPTQKPQESTSDELPPLSEALWNKPQPYAGYPMYPQTPPMMPMGYPGTPPMGQPNMGYPQGQVMGQAMGNPQVAPQPRISGLAREQMGLAQQQAIMYQMHNPAMRYNTF